MSAKMNDDSVKKHVDFLKQRMSESDISDYEKKIHRYSLDVIDYLKNRTGKKIVDDEQVRQLQSEGFTQQEIMQKLNISLSSVRRCWKKTPKDKVFTLVVDGEERKYFKRKLDVQKERDTLESESKHVYAIRKDLNGYYLEIV